MQVKRRFSIVERDEIVEKSSRCLWTNQGKPGREYLFTTRSLSEEVVRKFRLGYIPRFVNHQLKGRIIIPLYDPSGNLITVGSRAIEPSEFLPVYWHESYEKQFYLYGIDLARKAIQKHKFCVIVEGQFDVLQAANHGVENIVGLCGNKLSEVQISMIERYCRDIVLVLDTDENQAGQQGAAKALAANQYVWGLDKEWGKFDDKVDDPELDKVALRRGARQFPFPLSAVASSPVTTRQITAVHFPDNADPDEFIQKHGIDQFKKIIKGKLSELRNR